MKKSIIVLAVVTALVSLSSCSDKYREAIVGSWSFSYTVSSADMTKDKCMVNWTFQRGGDSPQFKETRYYDVEYKGEDGARIHCLCTARIQGTYDIILGTLMLDYSLSSLEVHASSSDVSISGGRGLSGLFEYYYDRSELAETAEEDVYQVMFTSCQEFNEFGSFAISEITGDTFVFEDEDLGTVSATRQ